MTSGFDPLAGLCGPVARVGGGSVAVSLNDRYSRGNVTVLDRPGLEQRTCECYAVVKKEYDRLLPDQVAS